MQALEQQLISATDGQERLDQTIHRLSQMEEAVERNQEEIRTDFKSSYKHMSAAWSLVEQLQKRLSTFEEKQNLQTVQMERAGKELDDLRNRNLELLETDEMLDQGDARGGGDRAGLMNVIVPDNYCTQATYRRAVGRRLRTARVVLNISQQDVADAAGCSRNFVSGIERGAQGVDAYRLSLVALALRMRPRTLLEGDGWDSWMNGMHLGADG